MGLPLVSPHHGHPRMAHDLTCGYRMEGIPGVLTLSQSLANTTRKGLKREITLIPRKIKMLYFLSTWICVPDFTYSKYLMCFCILGR